jgi:hypothetical protein
MIRPLRLAVLSATLAATFAFSPNVHAVNACGGEVHQYSACGYPNIYPCCFPANGNCTWWAAEAACRNFHIPLNWNWGNASTWGANAKLDPRFDVVSSPQPRSIATANSGGGWSSLGHVAWVEQVQGGTIVVSEQGCSTGGTRIRSYPSWRFNTGYVIPKGSLCDCSAGEQQTQDCNGCGSHTRQCGSDCKWGGWDQCKGPPEVCDGVDNDCNGLVDDGFPEQMGDPPPAYAATLIDSSYPKALGSDERGSAWVDFRNDGSEDWPKNGVWLRVSGSEDEVSELYDDSWPAWNVVATLDHTVSPGSTARFTFELLASAEKRKTLDTMFVLQMAGGADIQCPTPALHATIRVGPDDVPDAGNAGSAGQTGDEARPQSVSTSSGCSMTPASPSTGIGLLLCGLLVGLGRRRASSRKGQ